MRITISKAFPVDATKVQKLRIGKYLAKWFNNEVKFTHEDEEHIFICEDSVDTEVNAELTVTGGGYTVINRDLFLEESEQRPLDEIEGLVFNDMIDNKSDSIDDLDGF